MNLLIVSSYPPMACGIGVYAEQQANALRKAGHTVDIFSPDEGNGDFTGNLFGGFRFVRLWKFIWAYDRVIVHFTPSFFFRPDSALNRLCTSAAMLLTALFFGRRIEFVIHETEYVIGEAQAPRSKRRWIDRMAWRLSSRIVFHSNRERKAFLDYYSLAPSERRYRVVDHARHFVPNCSLDRAEARRRLAIPADKTVFLCVGFIQPHKGFDRLIRAVSSAAAPDALGYVVGSVRIAWDAAIEYARQLHKLAAADSRCEFIEEFVTPECFDMWIIASDYVVAPYENIWSSSVAGRAVMLGRPVIASRAGGLAEQVPDGSYLFETDDELAAIIRDIMDRPALTHSEAGP